MDPIHALRQALRGTREYEDARMSGAPDMDAIVIAATAAQQRYMLRQVALDPHRKL
jgi:hypothetical protein